LLTLVNKNTAVHCSSHRSASTNGKKYNFWF